LITVIFFVPVVQISSGHMFDSRLALFCPGTQNMIIAISRPEHAESRIWGRLEQREH
jgi:hypothetical protein